MKVHIGLNLKSIRLEKGFTQKELAAKVSGGVDYTYIGKIERGEQLPSLKVLLKISEALDIPITYFFHNGEAAIVHQICSSKLTSLDKSERGHEFLKALTLLHNDDIPLIIEIIKVLTKHRTASRKVSK